MLNILWYKVVIGGHLDDNKKMVNLNVQVQVNWV